VVLSNTPASVQSYTYGGQPSQLIRETTVGGNNDGTHFSHHLKRVRSLATSTQRRSISIIFTAQKSPCRYGYITCG